MAAFGRWEESVDLDIYSTGPIGLVFELPGEFPPTCVSDMLCQLRVFNHVLHGKVFSANHLVLVNQFAGQLVQVIQPAIRYFGVNTGYLELCLLPVLASEFLLGKTALVFGEFSGVFHRMAGIAGFEAVTGDEQILDAYIDANLFIIDRQQCRLKFAQAGHEVAPGLILGNGNGSRIAWQRSAPLDIKRIFALRQRQLTISVIEGALYKSRFLSVFFGFKHRVFRPAFKEVFERGLLVSQALLQRNAGYFIEKSKLRLLFDLGQLGIGANVTDFLFGLIVRIRSVSQDVIVNKAHTTKRLGKQFCLLGVWIESVLVCAFNFHGLHYIKKNVSEYYFIIGSRRCALYHRPK
jgi:hypothetical protein